MKASTYCEQILTAKEVWKEVVKEVGNEVVNDLGNTVRILLSHFIWGGFNNQRSRYWMTQPS